MDALPETRWRPITPPMHPRCTKWSPGYAYVSTQLHRSLQIFRFTTWYGKGEVEMMHSLNQWITLCSHEKCASWKHKKSAWDYLRTRLPRDDTVWWRSSLGNEGATRELWEAMTEDSKEPGERFDISDLHIKPSPSDQEKECKETLRVGAAILPQFKKRHRPVRYIELLSLT